MKLQERLRFELCRIADEECYDYGSHQLMMLRQDEAKELRAYLAAQEARIQALEEALRECLASWDRDGVKANSDSPEVRGRAKSILEG